MDVSICDDWCLSHASGRESKPKPRSFSIPIGGVNIFCKNTWWIWQGRINRTHPWHRHGMEGGWMMDWQPMIRWDRTGWWLQSSHFYGRTKDMFGTTISIQLSTFWCPKCLKKDADHCTSSTKKKCFDSTEQTANCAWPQTTPKLQFCLLRSSMIWAWFDGNNIFHRSLVQVASRCVHQKVTINCWTLYSEIVKSS